jgi:hypothetical protein
MLSSCLVLGLVVTLPLSGGENAVTAKLSPKVHKKWALLSPAETWTSIQGLIAIPHANGKGFATAKTGPLTLEVDTDADGKYDAKVKGAKGFVILKGKDAEGNAFRYGVRIRPKGKTHEFSCSSTMSGKINGVQIQLLDLNNNGRFDEIGKDGLIVGKSKGASFLSKVVNLKGKLFNIEVTPSGQEIAASPYEGEVGKLDLRSGFKSKGKLAFAVVSNKSGDVSFNVADAKKGMLVPVGSYHITGGRAVKGSEHATLKAGSMADMIVEADATTKLKWGMPVRAEIEFENNNGEIGVEPSKVHYVGVAGEEYANWVPDGSSPKLLIKDAKTGKLLESGRFAGC